MIDEKLTESLIKELSENKLTEDEYTDYIEQEKQLANEYCKRVTDKVTPDVIRNFGKLKEILEDGSNIVEQEGFYFPAEAIKILQNTDRRHNLNGYMDLTIADILNYVGGFDTPEEVIEDMFGEYKPDSALAWGDNFIAILSKLDFDIEEDEEEFDESKETIEEDKEIKTEGYTAREQFDTIRKKYSEEDKKEIKVVAETEHYILTAAKGVENPNRTYLSITTGRTDDHMLPDVYIEQDYNGTCTSAQINWGAHGSCDTTETLTFIKYLTEAVDFCSQIDGKDFSDEI